MTFTIKPYKPVLKVCVIFHPETIFDIQLPQIIYDSLTRDISDPLTRGLGIPVFLFDSIIDLASESVNSFETESAHHTVFIVLIVQKMVISPEWRDFVKEIWNFTKLSQGKHLFFPVDIDNTGKNIDIDMKKGINFLNLKHLPTDKMTTLFCINLNHELCRLLLQDLKKDKNRETTSSVKLFLSHAKEDGAVYAEDFRIFVHEKSGLNSFFDVMNIPTGSNFEDVIKDDLENSTMLIFQSDKFSSREWCRKEVLHAKKSGCPIIVIDCLTLGENRSFPYMANVPTIRWDFENENRLYEILMLSVQETLYNLYNIQNLNSITDVSEEKSGFLPWYRAPEVLTCLHLRDNPKYPQLNTLLYPDPPLSVEELNLLSNTMKDVHIVTPTQLHATKHNSQADVENSAIIAISISDSTSIPNNGLTKYHLKDSMVEFARYLLAAGTTIMYGGDLRVDGFTNTLYDLVSKHSEFNSKEKYKIISYLAWPFSRDLTEKKQAELANVAKIEKIDLPDDLRIQSEKKLNFDDPNDRYLISRGLIKMRNEMCQIAHARILLGGQTTDYLGRYPGIVEEALVTMKAGKPIYLMGAFGGATKMIIDLLLGGTPELLTLKKQLENSTFKEFFEIFNSESNKLKSMKDETINFDSLVSFFQNAGIDGLNNGLSQEENMRLFESVHINEMISLVLRGLSNCQLI